MSKRDTDCIKYILNEMDPSERIEFERKIEEDSDLLIEVESIREVRKKFKSLPLLNPPKNLSRSIWQQSGEYKNQSKKKRRTKKVSLAAAVLVIGLTGSTLFINDFDTNSGQADRAAFQNSPLLQTTITKTSNRAQPWVDNNEIIHFTGNSRAMDFVMDDSALLSNYPKLQPVNNPSVKQYFHRNLHLTGSGN